MKIRVFYHYFTLPQVWKLRGAIFRCLLNPKRIVNSLTILLSYFTGKTKPNSFPMVMIIEPTSECNLSCIMCPEVIDKSRLIKGKMPIEEYKKIIDEVGEHVFFLNLWNYGEPFMNKDTFGMIDYAKSKSIFVSMNTNFSLLSESDIERLINSGLDYLTISLDAAREETYNAIKRGGDFEKILRNIKFIIKTKKALNKPLPFVNLQFIIMKENEKEINEVIELASRLGADKLSFKKVYNFKQRLNNLLPENKKYILSAPGNKINSRFCMRLWVTSIILWNGDVVPCCYDFDFKHVLGNVFSQGGFRDVWRGESYALFRRNNLNYALAPDICRACLAGSFNTDLFLQMQKSDAQ